MTKKNTRTVRALALSSLAVLALGANLSPAIAAERHPRGAAALTAECEGNACDAVSLSYDGVAHVIRNNSGKKVTARFEGVMGAVTMDVEPGQSKRVLYFTWPMAIKLPYRANYA